MAPPKPCARNRRSGRALIDCASAEAPISATERGSNNAPRSLARSVARKLIRASLSYSQEYLGPSARAGVAWSLRKGELEMAFETERARVAHLLRRAGFGAPASQPPHHTGPGVAPPPGPPPN